jgi:hypothetical protein
MRPNFPPALAALTLLILSVKAYGHEGMADMPMPEYLGAVSFETSCKPQVKADFNRAVALLHSFWHDEAEHTFEKVAAADPRPCAAIPPKSGRCLHSRSRRVTIPRRAFLFPIPPSTMSSEC